MEPTLGRLLACCARRQRPHGRRAAAVPEIAKSGGLNADAEVTKPSSTGALIAQPVYREPD
jgi:hypothetical protein